ncbi:MAG: HEAT repeat domain-containing protein [Deltaproteobacteria bacterium]|nr:HEAT repeat domain-containing protein [Deltaproteobacteria bacterium]
MSSGKLRLARGWFLSSVVACGVAAEDEQPPAESPPREASTPSKHAALSMGEPVASREEVLTRLDSCRDPEERLELIRIERMLRRRTSPASIPPTDLESVREASGVEVLDAQAKLLSDASRPYELRLAAAEALAGGQRRGLDLLLEAARGPEPTGRAIAATALGRADAMDALAGLLGDSDPRVRVAAAHAIAPFPGAASKVAAALASENAPSVQVALLESLGRSGEDMSELAAYFDRDDAIGFAARHGAHLLAARTGTEPPAGAGKPHPPVVVDSKTDPPVR